MSQATPFAWFDTMPGLPRTSRTTHVPLFHNDLSEWYTARVTHKFMPAKGFATTGAAVIVYGFILFLLSNSFLYRYWQLGLIARL